MFLWDSTKPGITILFVDVFVGCLDVSVILFIITIIIVIVKFSCCIHSLCCQAAVLSATFWTVSLKGPVLSPVMYHDKHVLTACASELNSDMYTSAGLCLTPPLNCDVYLQQSLPVPTCLLGTVLN